MLETRRSESRSPRARCWGFALLGAGALAAWAGFTAGGTAVPTLRETAPAIAAEPADARGQTPAAMASPRVPAAELPAREPVASAPAQGAGEQARALLDAIVARLRLELAALPGAEPLRRCAPFATPACSTLLTDVLYELLDGRVVPAIEAREIDLGRLDRAQSAAALEPIMARLEQSEDPIERVAALVLLERASQLEAAALPSAAFSDLSGKPVIEAQLLLVYSQHEGLPDDTALREVAALAAARDLDSRVQGAALNALARRHVPELIAAVRALQPVHAREWSGWSDVVAPALARCGAACAEQSVELVAAATDPAALATQILNRCAPPQRAALLARLAPALPEDMLALARENAEL